MTQIKEIGTNDSFGDTGGISTSLGHNRAEASYATTSDYSTFYRDVGGSIEDFLSRPVILATYGLQATDTATTFPKLNILSAIRAAYAEKLIGKYSMAFDLEFTIEVSGTRFQQGRYMFCYLPSFYFNGGTGTTDTTLSSWKVSHAATLTQCTQLQHVEVDISVDKTAKLVIPFRYINPYIEMIYSPSQGAQSALPDYGIVFLRPYQPLQAVAGETDCALNIWLALKNVKFYGTANYQSGVAEQEAKSAGDGPISGPLGAVTKVLGALDNVPVIGGYTRPTSWVTEALARVAKHFGFSAPTIMNGVAPFYNMPFGFGANTDIPRPVQPLAYTINNAVSVSPKHSSSSIDEMSINYLAGIYAYKTGFTWTVGQVRNFLLFETAVNPMLPYATSVLPYGGGTVTVHHHNPAGYIASRFKYWRGSIKYKLKIVKTEFHTGKLLVCWHPGNEAIFDHTAPPTVGASYYRYRQVIDISVGNEFEFIVPYMSPRKWKNVLPVSPVTGGVVTSDFANGFFSVLVLDDLRAPQTVTPNVRILLECAGGSDFAVMGATPASVYSEQDGSERNAPEFCYMANYQASHDMPAENSTLVSYAFGSHEPMAHGSTVAAAEACGGELIESLRKVLKRYTRTIRTLNSGSIVNHILGIYSAPAIYWPATGDGVQQAFEQDDFAYYGQMFCFFRGSTRFRVSFSADSPSSSSLNRHQHRIMLTDATYRGQTSIFNPGAAPASGAVIMPTPSCAGTTYAVASLTEALEISIPYASPDSNILVQAASVPGLSPQGILLNGSAPGVPCYQAVHKALLPAAITLSLTFDRSLGDDASFAYFVSCPPVYDPRLAFG